MKTTWTQQAEIRKYKSIKDLVIQWASEEEALISKHLKLERYGPRKVGKI